MQLIGQAKRINSKMQFRTSIKICRSNCETKFYSKFLFQKANKLLIDERMRVCIYLSLSKMQQNYAGQLQIWKSKKSSFSTTENIVRAATEKATITFRGFA
jgi:hypothetical protein